MGRGWKEKSEISTWVNVSSVPGRPKWREVEEHPIDSIREERAGTLPDPPPPTISLPRDDDLFHDLTGEPPGMSFSRRPTGKVIFQ